MVNPFSNVILGPETPEWQIVTALVIITVVMLFSLGWSFVVERRFTGPYTLLAATSKQKWEMAAKVMFWQTLMFPFLGFAAPIISPFPDQQAFIPFCVGAWVVGYPAAVIVKRWHFTKQLKSHKRLSKMKKDDRYQPFMAFFQWFNFVLNDEMKRFMDEGYPDEVDGGME
ncbi:MAG: hypothetical protein OEZ02_11760 [Anaerolineae bacterium]|nr:hypothetical protein [Anaerolineae bacterium]